MCARLPCVSTCVAEGAWLGLTWELGQVHCPVLPEGVSSLKPVNKVCYLLHVTAACEDALPGAGGLSA